MAVDKKEAVIDYLCKSFDKNESPVYVKFSSHRKKYPYNFYLSLFPSNDLPSLAGMVNIYDTSDGLRLVYEAPISNYYPPLPLFIKFHRVSLKTIKSQLDPFIEDIKSSYVLGYNNKNFISEHLSEYLTKRFVK